MHLKETNPEKTPHLFFNPRTVPHPDWVENTDYIIGDFCTVSGVEYKCYGDHTSSIFIEDLHFELGEAVYWIKYGRAPYPDYPVFDQDHLEETTATGKGLRRRAKSKVSDIPVDQVANARFEEITGKTHFFVDLFYDGDLTATWELQPQYLFAPDDWRDQELTGTVEIDNELGKMTCAGVQGGFSWDIEINFTRFNSKWHWSVTAPGFTVRAKWVIVFTALGQQMLADEDLKLGYSDYTGITSDDDGIETRTIIFEPDGIDASGGWLLDPYLTVDEQAALFDVYMDGVVVRIGTSDTATFIMGNIYPPDDVGGTILAYINNAVKVTDEYNMARADDQTYTVLENTPERIKVLHTGIPEKADGTDLAGTTMLRFYYTFYSDRFVVRAEWDTSAAITLDDNISANHMFQISESNCTNEDSVAEDTGSEETGIAAYRSRPTADYIGWVSDELDVIMIMLEQALESGSATYTQYFVNVGDSGFSWNNGTVGTAASNETHTMTIAVILDSADRVGGKQYGAAASATDRLAMGDQYKDATIDQAPTDGDDVTDTVIPARISTGTLHSDGAHHYTAENSADGVTGITMDRTRIRPSFVIADAVFNSGSVAAPTNHLLNHLKLNDNAASAVLAGEVGPDATWSNISDGSDRNTNTTDDSVQEIGRGRNLDTQGGAGYIELPFGVGTVHNNAFFKKGSLLIKFKPQFAWNGVDQRPFHLSVDGSNYIAFVYNAAGDNLELFLAWGGTYPTLVGPVYTENYSLQREMVILLFWDSDKDLVGWAIDGQVVNFGAGTGTPSASEPIGVAIGSKIDRTQTADIIIDDIKTFNACILPYGAYFIGNGAGLLADIDNPHKNLSWFFDGQAALAKGGTDLGDTDNPTNTGGQFAATSPILGANVWDSNGTGNVLTVADTAEDIVDYNKGFVAGWFKVIAAAGGEYLIDVRDGDGSDRISAVLDASNNIDVTYRSASTDEVITGDIAITDGAWFYLKITWDDTGSVHSYINGVENGTAQAIANTWTGGNGLTWYFTEDYNAANGVDAHVGAIYMGKAPNTPEIWTAFGKPLHNLLTDVS